MKGLYPEGTGLKIPKNIEFSKLLNPPMESKNPVYSNIEGDGALKNHLGSAAIFSNTIGKDELFHKNLEKYCPFLYKETTHIYKKQIKKTSQLQSIIDLGDEIEKMYPCKENFPNHPKYTITTLNFFADALHSYYFITGKTPRKELDVGTDLWKKLRRVRTYNQIASHFMYRDLRIKWTTGIADKIVDIFSQKVKFSGEVEKEEHIGNTHYADQPEVAMPYKLKYLGFSGHDDTIISFLMQWGFSNQQCHLDLINGVELKENEPCFGTPHFGANLIWELNKDTETGKYYVAVLYNGENLEVNCGEKGKVKDCPFEDFVKEMKKNFIFTKEYEKKLCNNYGNNENYDEQNHRMYYLFIGWWCILMLLLSILLCVVTVFLYRKAERLDKDNRANSEEFSALSLEA